MRREVLWPPVEVDSLARAFELFAGLDPSEPRALDRVALRLRTRASEILAAARRRRLAVRARQLAGLAKELVTIYVLAQQPGGSQLKG